ncbi:MAG: 4Fe-4S binding protein, partial [Armatimonadota bacterium]
YESEIRGAEEEGIHLHTARAPKQIVADNGRVTGLETLAVSSVFDDQGRFNPTVVEDTEEVLEGDTVVLAIGQMADLSFLTPEDELQVTPAGLLGADPDTGRTDVPGLFGVGDAVVGPQNIIEVIADAHRVADAVRAYLEGDAAPPPRDCKSTAVEPTTDDEYDRLQRLPTRMVAPHERRSHLGEVDLGYSAPQALEEARRCLQCDRNIFIDPDRCVLCGACVEVCPYECIRMVPVDEIATDEGIEELGIARSWPQGATAMALDETSCIRCGICIRRCPADAISMEHLVPTGTEDTADE